MRSGASCAASAVLLWAVTLAHAQAPPAPVCNHQWVPNGQPSLGPPALACPNPSTPAYTNFTVMATEN